eukprot:EC688242.1.p3 GENE.EC688242.1~~EC688242.1.p3  ORF type:complete len:57 (+),score=2.59 EC688242.1:1-171(+)
MRRSPTAVEREIGRASIASMSDLDPETCFALFESAPELWAVLVRLLWDASPSARAV